MPKKPVQAKLLIAVFISAALLPLSAIAETINGKEVNELPAETYAENISDSSENKVNEVTNSTLNSQDIASSDNPKSATADTGLVSNPISESSSASTGTNTTSNNSSSASETTSPLGKAENRAAVNTEKKAIERQPETVEKTPFWQNTDYLLIGALTFLILGSGLLLFRKISGLNAENRHLNQKHNALNSTLATTKQKLAQANGKNERLEADLKQQLAMYDEQTNTSEDFLDMALPLMDVSEELPVIEDLNVSDRKQLADSITTWFKTNRGNTAIRDLVPAEIQKKLDHLNYKIELWVGSDGVDSVELASDTKRAAVISLTKPDRQGFAYCYIKPNALSSTWVNKAWYKVQRTNSTLEVLGEPLEIN